MGAPTFKKIGMFVMTEYTAAIKASYILMFFLFLFLHVFTNLYGGHGKYLIGA